MEDLEYWVWISKIKKLGSIKAQRLLETYKNPKQIWDAKKEDLLKIEGIGEKIVEEILSNKYRIGLKEEIKKMKKEKVELISIYDEIYPKNLKEIYDKPICLYVKGNKEILNEFSLAMIGCRENSTYGKEVATAVAKGLAKNNIITVSGFAR